VGEDKKRNGGHLVAVASAAALVLSLLGIGGYVVAIAADHADTKRRVSNVESRQAEDRAETKNDVKEVKQDIKDVKKDVEQIRLLLERMRQERRER
jgi:hypothetical protein